MPKRRKVDPEDAASTIGAWIKTARRRQGITQSALAEQLGLSHQQVSKYERYADDISALRLIQIARILRASVVSLFEAIEPGFGEAAQASYVTSRDDEIGKKFAELRLDIDALELALRNSKTS